MTVPILVVANTGEGKSYSLRNLEPQRTIVFNCDQKPLPFRNAGKFKNIPINDYGTFKKTLAKAVKSEDYDTIVIDTFTFLADMIEVDGRKIYGKSYDMWSFYADEIRETLKTLNSCGKNVVVMAHPAYLKDEELIQGVYAKLKGQLASGGLESHFSVVLHAHISEDEDGLSKFQFDTTANSKTSAKSPPEMFEHRYIDNDMKLVFDKVSEYYGSES